MPAQAHGETVYPLLLARARPHSLAAPPIPPPTRCPRPRPRPSRLRHYLVQYVPAVPHARCQVLQRSHAAAAAALQRLCASCACASPCNHPRCCQQRPHQVRAAPPRRVQHSARGAPLAPAPAPAPTKDQAPPIIKAHLHPSAL